MRATTTLQAFVLVGLLGGGAVLLVPGVLRAQPVRPVAHDVFGISDERFLGPADELVWTAVALRQLLADQDLPAVLLTSALTRLVAKEGVDALAGTEPLLAALRLRALPGARVTAPLQRCRNDGDPVEGALCAAEHLIPLAPPSLARELTEEGARFVGQYLKPGEVAGMRAAVAGELAPTLDPLQSFAEEALERAWLLRTGGADGLVSALDQVLSGLVGFAPGEGADGMLPRVPELRALVASHPVLAMAGEPSRPLEAVVSEYRAFLGEVTGSLAGFLSPLPSTSDAAALLAAGAEGRDRDVAEWATQRSFVYLASRSAALAGADEAVAGRIRALGNAAADLQRGASSFTTNLAWMGRHVATAALSGNVLSVAARLTAFFDGTPGALGPGAAGEIRALREGIDVVRAEMSDGFDGMDERFDDVLTVLDARFGRLEQLAAVTNRDVRLELSTLHQEVLALGQRLEHMEENLHSYIEAGFDRDYSRTLVRCLEHRERYLPPFDEMPFSAFADCLSDFRARAVRDSRDALLTDQATLVDDLSLASALSDPSLQNLARRFPLLGRAAEQRFGYADLGGGRGLANAVEWAVASQAYLTLLQEWPEYARAIGPDDLEAMRSVGLSLQAALRSVTVDGTAARGTLLYRVLDHYQRQLTDLTAEADVLARRHQQAQLRRVPPGSILTEIEGLDPERPALAVPQHLADRAPQEVRTAAVLALGDAGFAYRLALEDSVSRENPRRRMRIFGRRHDRLTFTRTRIEVELRFADGGPRATYHAAGPFVLRSTEEMAGDEESDRVLARTDHVTDPEAHFLTETWPGLSENASAWQASAAAPTFLQTLEQRIEEELRRHATVALNNVFAAVCLPGTGRPESVQGMDGESVVRIRTALDGLTAARALLGAYVRLALPFSAEADGDLDAALFGSDAILDRAGLCEVVAAGESALRLVWLDEEPRRRADALSRALVAALEREAEAPEPLPLVESTLLQLEAAVRLQRLRAMVARVDR